MKALNFIKLLVSPITTIVITSILIAVVSLFIYSSVTMINDITITAFSFICGALSIIPVRLYAISLYYDIAFICRSIKLDNL